MNENLEKYSQNYLHNRQQNQYDNSYPQSNQQNRQYSQPIEQSRHQSNKEQYDIKQVYGMLQQSQEHNENLKNIIDDLKKQLREYKHKFELSSKENEQLKSQYKLQSEKNEIYLMRINTFEESEQNLKQKVSDLSSKYEYLKNKYQELSKKCKQLEIQNQAYQQSKKENDQTLYKPENRVQTNPVNDDSPNNFQSVNSGVNSRQQLSQITKNSLKKINSIDFSSQGGSIQDIDKYAFQVLKQQHNQQSLSNLTPQNQNTKQLYPSDQVNQQNNISSYQQMSSNKISQENSSNKIPSQSPRSYSQIEGSNQSNNINGVQMLKNNYINQMQSAAVNNNQTPIRNSTSVPALFRTAKTESQHSENISDMKTNPSILQKKNNEILPNNYQPNQKQYSDNKQIQQKSLLFPQQNSSSNYYQEEGYGSFNKFQNSSTVALENPNEQSKGENNYNSNMHQKPPIIKKMDQIHNQSQYDQQRQNEICVAYGRINSHRATSENQTPTNSSYQNLNNFENYSQQTKNMQQAAAINQLSNPSVTYLGDQSTLSNSQGQSSQQYMSQSSKNTQLQQQNALASSQGHNTSNKNFQQNNLSIGQYYPTNPSSYDITYSESNLSSNQNYQTGNKDMYSSLNNRNQQNQSQLNDAHMYSTNPVHTSDYSSTNHQLNKNVQISSFNKNALQNNSSSKQQSSGLKTQSVTDFNHQIPKYASGDYEKSNPQSETKIDSEIHTPQKPNIFQSKSVFNNNQINLQTFQAANVNHSSVMKENDFAEHLISNEGIQVKKRSQVLHASRRDPNTNSQYSPTSSSHQKLSQYEDKQLMKALFGTENSVQTKESGIPLNYTKNSDKMFEISQRVENEYDLNKQNDRIVPSLNPSFPQNNNSLSNSSNNSYNQSQFEKRSQSIKNIPSNQVIDNDSMANLDSASDNRQKLRTSERNNNNLKTIQIQPFGQGSTNLNTKPYKMAKLIENFIVISANSEKTKQLSKQNVFNVDQEIIFRAAEPKNDMENEQLKVVSKFCFPQGVEVHKYKRENFSSDILKMINTHKELQSKEYFVFPIKSAESFEKKVSNQIQTLDYKEGIDEVMNPNKFLYCVCVITRDYIDPISSQQRMFKSENNTQAQHYYQVSSIYCIITKYPFFNFFFDLILQFINKMNINKKNYITDFQPKNLLPSALDFQQIDLSSFKKHINQGVLKVIQSCIKGEIGIDFNIVHKFSVGQELLSLTVPQRDSCYLLEARWGVMQTLTIMNVYEFLYILFSLLLEESLVFLSKNPSTLSQTMMMFMSALKPFKWPHPFVMFLSNDLMHMFDSPFPLVIGINKSYDFIKDNKLYKTHPHCIFVNLDEFGISEKKESIYQSSTYTSLTQKIKGDYEQLKQLFNKKDAYNDFSQQLFDISNTIYDKIRKFFKDTLNKILPAKPILDQKNNLDYDQMKIIIQKNSIQGDQFIEKFVQSQIFSYYLEEHYNI
ncbi:DENN (AEX-3) domain protein (macronuclear) [Tetrahymena thermophila SB210]|uniref:DENN (AEX-3) domain protein n=1 Tax=Tetrahymena thermophila (strain SB210) TaxID=312017 RepID=I7LWY3_TETTS|nr:DENN (AEX-3) domain protein [Tetrahymena thermophila SB210]EAS03082.2 DENN (AEX-3) domain protein [Tetrahymena thermophila SB210]|eukprot:XP_001023327.2 DENN (AEX-3) domain protein [Tetrahymena thermophila SB210]